MKILNWLKKLIKSINEGIKTAMEYYYSGGK